MKMKINIPSATPKRIRPKTPTVVLTDEAYDMLLNLSYCHNVSMRQLASAIIVQSVTEGLKIEKE